MKNPPLLRFHNKDITAVPLPDGTTQGFYRQAPHVGENPRLGHWQPLDGITYSKHAHIPAVAETRAYWENEDPKAKPGMGNMTLQKIARDLDEANLPNPAEHTSDPFRVNEFLNTERSLEINDYLDRLDQHFKDTEQIGLRQKVDEAITHSEDKILAAKRNPIQKGLLDKIMDLVSDLGEKRAQRVRGSLVPAKVVIALLIVNPIIHLGDLRAQDTKGYPAKENIEMAFSRLQSMTGAQIKNLLEAIPEKDRVKLVEHLPSRLLPPLMPKGFAARNVHMVPESELKKGFAKITQKEFEAAAQAIPEATQNQLLKLLIDAISQNKKTSQKTADLEPTV